MSSARARRTFVPPNAGPTGPAAAAAQQQQQSVNTPGLTLPQVISLIDTRLIALEQFMREQKSAGPVTNDLLANASVANSDATVALHEEYQHRFEVLTEEIMTVKDLLLKLQSYTMDVNKALYEERIHVFSDLGNLANSDDGEQDLDPVPAPGPVLEEPKDLINGPNDDVAVPVVCVFAYPNLNC